MSIIRLLKCWLLVYITDPGIDDFCALCTEYDRKKSKIAEYTLKKYFGSYAPGDAEIRRIYEGSDDLKALYFQNIRPGRKLSAYEQHRLVLSMPVNRFNRFPSPLDKQYLLRLFDKANKPKLAAYAESFALPPDLELRLIDLCAQEGQTNCPLNSYHYILQRYLSSAAKKMKTPDVQLAVLALDDKNLTLALVENCNMENNILYIEALRHLVENADREVLSSLLLHSFIQSDELAKKMLERFPDLRCMHEISRLRHALRKLELEMKCFLGVIAPSETELDFICQSIEKDAKGDDRADFVEYVLRPKLQHNNVTPYFAAWAADEFPEVSEQAHQCVRKRAQKLYDLCKKSA